MPIADLGSREREAAPRVANPSAIEALRPVQVTEGDIIDLLGKYVGRHRMGAANEDPPLRTLAFLATGAV